MGEHRCLNVRASRRSRSLSIFKAQKPRAPTSAERSCKNQHLWPGPDGEGLSVAISAINSAGSFSPTAFAQAMREPYREVS